MIHPADAADGARELCLPSDEHDFACSPPARRLLAAAGLLVAALVACGREVTAPNDGPINPGNAFRRAGLVAIDPKYETAIPAPLLRAALAQVPFTKIHIVLKREDGTIAVDKFVDFPDNATELTLTLDVPLPSNTPAGGSPFKLQLDYVNAAGETVFSGSSDINVKPINPSNPTPTTPEEVKVSYTGPGASATDVAITGARTSGLVGDVLNFSATARSSTGTVIPNTPIVFSSTDASIVSVANPAVGSAILVGAGTASVCAQLLTGPKDCLTIRATRPAANLAITSGNDQTALAGSTLPASIVARVTASDGSPVQGVAVSFGVTSGGGSVTPATGTSDINGNVTTSWKLGQTAGPQTMTATSGTLIGSPAVVRANATALTASRLVVTTQPVDGKAATALAPIAVTAQDANGNTVTSFTGDVSVVMGANAAGSTLTGTTTVKAVNGVATFSDLKLNKIGTGYTLVFNSAPLSSAATNAFAIAAGSAAKLVFGTMPSAVDAGIAIAPAITVTAQDDAGNTVTSFTGAVTLAIGTNPGAATLTGTLVRNAVAGVASFNDISINKKGASYTLTAASPSMVGGTSAGFTVLPGAPTAIAIVSGAGQTAAASATLPNPIRLQVRDALGNGVNGLTLSVAATLGGGSVTPTSLVTDADGFGQFTWTLGPTGGANNATITLATPSLSGVVTATATGAVVGPATQLIVTGQPTATQTAGTAGGAIVVTAKDAGGNVATTFTGTVALAINTGPGGATVIGPVSANAVSGIATFGGVSFDKAGSYTLKFTSGALTQGTSNSFTVGAGAAANIAADSGASQAGAAGQPLPAQIVVRVTDTYGNPVSGTTVTWTPKPSSGSLSGTTTSTDAAGRARTTWTIGTTYTGVNADTLDVTSGTLAGSPVRFFATGNTVAYNKAWTGAIDNSWATAGNWSPSGVPVATDSVLIQNVANAATVSSPVTVSKLTVAAGAAMVLNADVTVNGSLNAQAGTGFSGTGILQMSGTGTITALGTLPYTNINGAYTLASNGFFSDVEVKTGGSLNTNSFNVTLNNNFSTNGTGTLIQAGGTIAVSGSASFGGGDETGKLTGGILQISKNFTQSVGAIASTFVAQSTHTVQFVSGFAHAVSFADPTQSWFNHFTNNSAVGGVVTFNTNARVLGTITVASGAPAINATGSGKRIFLGAGISDVSGNGANFTADTVELVSNAAVTLPTTLNAGLVVSGSTATLQSNTTVTGAVRVTGTLDLNGHTLITPAFSTSGSGLLKMINGSNADVLIVNGPATFGGGDQSGLLTGGTIRVRGNFQQVNTGAGVGNSFRASGTHTVAFDSSFTGATVHSVTFANPDGATSATCAAGNSCFNNVTVAHNTGNGAVYFTSSFKALGSVDLTGLGVDSVSAPNALRPTGATSSLAIVNGQWNSGAVTSRRFNRLALGGTAFGGVSGVAIDTLIFYGAGQDFQPNGNAIGAAAVRISGTANTASGTPLSFNGPVSVDGASAVLDIGNPGGKLTVSAFKTLNGGKLKMTDASDTLVVTGNADFGGGATVGLLTAGALQVNGNFNATGVAYDASGTHATIMAGNTGTQTIAWSTPTAGKGHHDLIVRNLAARQFSGDQYITGNVVMSATATSGTLSGSYNIYVGGAIIDSTGLGTGGWTGSSMINFTGNPSELPAKLGVNTLKFAGGGTTSLVRDLNTNYVIVDGTGSRLKLNGHVLTTNGNDFTTQNNGTLEMTVAGDSLVTGRAFFNGGSTSGLLTTGSLATGGFSQGVNATAYAADSTHKTWLSSGGGVQITFANPDSGASGSHFGTLIHNTTSTVTLNSNVIVEGVLQTAPAVQHDFTASASRLLVARGASVNHLYMTKVRLRINNGQAVSQLDDIKFSSMVTTDTQFIIARSGTGTAGFVPTINGILFQTAPTGIGLYLHGHDTDGSSPDALIVNLSGTYSPTVHGGWAVFDNGATSNWVGVATVTAASSGNWSSGATWVGAIAPGANDNIIIPNGITVTLDGDVSANNVTVNGTLFTDNTPPAHTITVKGNLTGTGSVTGDGTVSVGGTGANQTLSIPFVPNLSVLAGALATLGADLQSQKNVSVAGKLIINGHTLSVWNILSTSGTGGVKMTNPADSIDTYDAQFAGAASDTLLTDGALLIWDALEQGGDPKAFAPTGNHRTILEGGGTNLMMADQRARVRKWARAYAVEQAVPLRRGRRFSTNGVFFANPGYTTSHFNILKFDHTNDASVVFDSDVYANLAQTIGMTSQRTVYGTSQTIKFSMKSPDIDKLTFANMMVQIDSSGTFTKFDHVQFSGQADNVDQLTLVLPNTANVSLASASFSTAPVTGHYVVTRTAAAGSATVNYTSPNPGSHGGHYSTPSGSIVTNGWQATRSLTAATSGNWSNPLTWGGNTAPSLYDDVTIGGTNSVTVDGFDTVKDLTLAATATLNIGFQALYSYGNWTADSATTINYSSGTIRHFGAKTVVGNIGPAYFYGDVTLGSGSTTYSPTTVTIKAGTFDVNSRTFRVGGHLYVDSAAVFKMMAGGGLTDVTYDANFTGSSTVGTITNGTIRVGGNFYQDATYSASAFAASGSNKVILTGESGSAIVSMTNPDSTSAGSHFSDLQIGDLTTQTITIYTDIWVTKKLTRGTPSAMTLARHASLASNFAPTIYTADLQSSGSLIFDRVRLYVYDMTASTSLSDATFQNFSNTAFEHQLQLRYMGSTPLTNSNFSWINFTTTLGNTYNYVLADQFGTGALVINMNSMNPSSPGGKVAQIGGAIVNWFST